MKILGLILISIKSLYQKWIDFKSKFVLIPSELGRRRFDTAIYMYAFAYLIFHLLEEKLLKNQSEIFSHVYL